MSSPLEFEIFSTETLSDGFLPVKRLELRFRHYNGCWGETIFRECYTPQYQSAGVLLYDPNKQQIALVEQIRMGAIFQDKHPWLIELVMGMVDNATELPNETAMREAQEEAGVVVQRLIPITNYFVSPGTSSEYVHLFCGIVDIDTFSGIHGLAQEQEDIRVVKLSLEEARQALANGRVNNAATIIAIQWLLLNFKTIN